MLRQLFTYNLDLSVIPFFFQNRPLDRVLVDRVAVFVIHESYELPKKALLAHTQF